MKNRKIRVAHLMWGGGGKGGVDRVDSSLYRHLDRAVFDPVFVYLNSPHEDDGYYFPKSATFLYTGRENRFESLREILEDADIATFQGGFAPLACHCAKSASVPVIVEVLHNMEEGRLYDFIDVTFCVSKAVYDIQPDKEKCVIVPNGIDAGLFPYHTRKRERTRIRILITKQMALTIREVATALLAIDPRIEIDVVGAVAGLENFESQRVHFHGQVADMNIFYSKADIVLLLTPSEAFGLVLLEAMATGAMAVVSDVGGPAEIINNGQDGFLVSPFSVEDISLGVARAIKAVDNGDSDRIGVMAHRKVVDKYSEEASVRRWEKLFARLIEEKGRDRFPTTGIIHPPVDVLVEEALFYYNNNDNNKFITTIAAVASHPERLSNLRISAVVAWLGLMAKGAGDERSAASLADKSFSYIFENRIDLASLIVLIGTQRGKELATDEFEQWMVTGATSLLEQKLVKEAVELLRFGAICLGKRGDQYNLLAHEILDGQSK